MQLNKETGVYESEEFQVAVGDHNCHLNVDQKDYKVEPLQIRFYTFEADVFLTGECKNSFRSCHSNVEVLLSLVQCARDNEQLCCNVLDCILGTL